MPAKKAPPRPPRPTPGTIPAGNLTNPQRDAILRNLAERVAALEADTDTRVAPTAGELRARLAGVLKP